MIIIAVVAYIACFAGMFYCAYRMIYYFDKSWDDHNKRIDKMWEEHNLKLFGKKQLQDEKTY
jgi:uncharacterized membrane protein